MDLIIHLKVNRSSIAIDRAKCSASIILSAIPSGRQLIKRIGKLLIHMTHPVRLLNQFSLLWSFWLHIPAKSAFT